jgi:hypothetical protein
MFCAVMMIMLKHHAYTYICFIVTWRATPSEMALGLSFVRGLGQQIFADLTTGRRS